MSLRDRACLAVLEGRRERILMVQHGSGEGSYWTLPGGGLEDLETLAEAAVRECLEETGLEAEAGEPLFDETYTFGGQACGCRCFRGTLTGGGTLGLGADPEQGHLDADSRLLQAVAWLPVADLGGDPQVSRVLRALDSGRADLDPGFGPLPHEAEGYFRVHTEDKTWTTGQPRGLFTAVGRLVDAGRLAPDEVDAYWRNRAWFEAHLPVPPFYGDGNSLKAVTWFKAGAPGRALFERMGFYRRMAAQYGVPLHLSYSRSVPGTLVYEDDFQVGVTGDSPAVMTRPLR